MHCSNCGAESAGSVSICSTCGARFAARWRQGRRCGRCGRYVGTNLRICPSCSAALPRHTDSWGLGLLGLLAAAALAYNATTYGLRVEVPPRVARWHVRATATVAEWQERVQSLLQRVDPQQYLPQVPTR